MRQFIQIVSPRHRKRRLCRAGDIQSAREHAVWISNGMTTLFCLLSLILVTLFQSGMALSGFVLLGIIVSALATAVVLYVNHISIKQIEDDGLFLPNVMNW